jgi:hypothetical protein
LTEQSDDGRSRPPTLSAREAADLAQVGVTTLMTIALSIKAANAAHRDQKMNALAWRSQGKNPEAFPVLDIN